MRRALAICLALAACTEPALVAPDASPVPAPEPERVLSPRPAPATITGTLSIPAGAVIAGSLPGTPGRRPSREADEIPIELPAFEIDRLPYPNDPLAAPRLVTSRREAEALCAERGARLCGELEWERACEGPGNDRFPGGAHLDVDRCTADPARCPSRDGVSSMGLERPEWTAGEVPSGSARMGRTAILRGALADAPIELHRCASRGFEVPDDAPPAAFRCCRGAMPPPAYPAIPMHRDVRDLAPSLDELRAALRSVPVLAPFADDFRPYDATDGDRALARGDVGRSALAGWELAPGPFAWSPSAGEEAWVIAGSSGTHALLAILYPLAGGRFVHGGSFVIEPEPGEARAAPIAIARTPPSRGELQWSTCWGCPGEGGVIRFADDATIRVAQR